MTEGKSMVAKKFYNIEEMSAILGKTIASIYGHLARRQWDAVPMPMKLGCRLAWLVSAVDEWVDMKLKQVSAQLTAHEKHLTSVPKKRGRPTKAEAREKEKGGVAR